MIWGSAYLIWDGGKTFRSLPLLGTAFKQGKFVMVCVGVNLV